MNQINWGNNGILNNPYSFIPQMEAPAPQMQVIRVNGENGADAFRLGANSSALLLDETAPIVWLVQTDGAGYKTKTAYDISVHQNEQNVEMKTMDDKITAIEKRLIAIEEALRDESDS